MHCDIRVSDLSATLSVSAFGPLLMAKHLAPMLQKGDGIVGSHSQKNTTVQFDNKHVKLSR